MKKNKPKTIPAGKILMRTIQWIWVIVLLFAAGSALLVGSVIIAFSSLISAFLIFPYCNNILIRLFNVRLSTTSRIILAIVLFLPTYAIWWIIKNETNSKRHALHDYYTSYICLCLLSTLLLLLWFWLFWWLWLVCIGFGRRRRNE